MQNILRIVLMETADTHWYCKCVAMIDIFLRLYNIEDMFRTQICHYSACLLKTGIVSLTSTHPVCKLTSSECRMASS